MSAPKFTFKNYLLALKKTWFVLVIFFVIGGILGGYYSFKKVTQYTSSSRVFVYNSTIDNGSMTSPYAPIGEILLSKKILESTNKKLADLPNYTVIEAARGTFVITTTADTPERAKEAAKDIATNAKSAIAVAYDDSEKYRITILEEGTDATPSITLKTRIISTAVAAFGALFIAMIAVFIKFDYKSEK